MTSIINKRQQARNERMLQELIRSVPGNDQCADCSAKNPGWASWSLGAFLCMRCGSLHRKMGTHISKVKSLSMDSWTSEQVENMRKRGNIAVNKEYNPRNIKPDIPVDVDEVDSAMERFIRQKYEFRILEDGKPKPPSRDDSGYHTQKSLDESPPPPLPPKTGRKFGFGLRSVSSTSRLPRHSDKSSLPSPTSRSGGLLSPTLSLNKPSRVFGANVGEVDSVEAKLDQLRDMGFPNHKRNASILKGVGGDLNRAIESLIRLGEGGGLQVAVPRKPSTATSLPTPNTSKPEADDPWSMTATVTSSAGAHTTSSPAKSYNPFDVPNTQNSSTAGIENAFQNLQVAPPLSPHTTGGYTSQQNNMSLTPIHTSYSYTSSPQPLSYNPFFQTASPTTHNIGNPYFGSQTAQSTPIQPTRSFSPGNPFANSLSAQNTGVQQNSTAASQSQRFAMPRHANTMPVFSSSYASSPQIPATFFPQQPQINSPQVLSTNPFDATPNNNINNNYSNNVFQQQPQHIQQQTPYAQFQQTVMQQPTRPDKNSILALYNLAPATAPTMSTIPEQSQVPQAQPSAGQPASSSYNASTGPTAQTIQSQTPYGTFPQGNVISGSTQAAPSTNPFMNKTPQQQQHQPQLLQNTNPFSMTTAKPTAPTAPSVGQSNGLGIGLGPNPAAVPASTFQQPPPTQMNNNFMSRTPFHMSKASVDISNLQNGRHSPDAFASLSARYA